MFWRFAGLIVVLLLSCTSNDQRQSGSLDASSAQLAQYLIDNYRSPEDFVISCFDNHDIVFLGEYHRIKHDVELVHHLIPQMYEAGIHHLGIEFADYADQDAIDRLITGPEYDDSLARQIQFNQWPYWGFREYVDIYRVVWQLNQGLSDDQPKFRVVGLNANSDWSHVWTDEDRQNKEIMKKVWPYGGADEHMAKIIKREFVDQGHQALIYCGISHGYTRYQQPVYDAQGDTVTRLITQRAGNRVYQEIGDKAMTIFLHAPWPAYQASNEMTYPVDGVIDSLISNLDAKYRRVGFMVTNSPFAALKSETGFWRLGHPNFTLQDYCDGYIYQRPLSEYEGVAVIDGFINQANRLTAISQISNPRAKDTAQSAAELMKSLVRDTDFSRRFRQFGDNQTP